MITPIYNNPGQLVRLFACFAAQTLAKTSFEVIVVDNGSAPPETLPAPAGFAAKIVVETARGSYAARNRGLQEARGALVVFTDSDCRPEPRWLEEALAAAEASARPSVFGGRIVQMLPEDRAPSWAGLYDANFNLDQSLYVANGFAATANMFAPRAVFDTIGAFDASLMSNGDVEWGARAQAAGVPIVYAERAVVRHHARTSVSELVRIQRRYLGGHLQLRRRPGQRELPMFKNFYRNFLPYPPLRILARIARLSGVGLGDKLGLMGLATFLKAARAFEALRLMLPGALAERR